MRNIFIKVRRIPWQQTRLGFAPAASPLASTIVQTPDDAIAAGFTLIPSQGDNMPAYHARPKQSDGPLPVVIVVQVVFGVHEHIRGIVAVWRWRVSGYRT
ncbi:dienelactone hydrolase family protein [Escherichia coli]